MSRGYKAGPFKALKTKQTQSGKNAVGLAPCPSCGEQLPVIIDNKGWPNLICPIKTGCGFKAVALNKGSSVYVLGWVRQWAEPENVELCASLAAKIDLYPAPKPRGNWGDSEADKVTSKPPAVKGVEPQESGLVPPEPSKGGEGGGAAVIPKRDNSKNEPLAIKSDPETIVSDF